MMVAFHQAREVTVDIKFPVKSSRSADGQAAWAMMYGLLKVLQEKGVFIDSDLRNMVAYAESVAPSQPNAIDDEVREMLAALR
jgi:hypothetical protein